MPAGLLPNPYLNSTFLQVAVGLSRSGEGAIAPANRESKFPVCRCPEAEEGNRREPGRARHSKSLLAGSSSDRPPAPACGREYVLASLTADSLRVESKHILRFSTN